MIMEVQELIGKGVSKRKISKVLKIARGTVYRYSCGEPEFLAESNRPAFTKLEPFQEEIVSLINNKIIKKDAYYYIAKKGYTGGLTQFYEYCKYLAEIDLVEAPGNLRIDELRDAQTKQKYHYVTRNQIFHYIWNGESEIDRDDVEFLKNSFPVIETLSQCLFQFRNIFETKSNNALSEYIATYKNCELEPLKKNAESMEKDLIPIINAVVEEYSNGFVEGTNNKLKVIKRVAYGRCKLPLLKSKIVLSGFFCL